MKPNYLNHFALSCIDPHTDFPANCLVIRLSPKRILKLCAKAARVLGSADEYPLFRIKKDFAVYAGHPGRVCPPEDAGAEQQGDAAAPLKVCRCFIEFDRNNRWRLHIEHVAGLMFFHTTWFPLAALYARGLSPVCRKGVR